MYTNPFLESASASSVTNSSNTSTGTWTNPSASIYTTASGHLPLPYASFDPGPSTSAVYPQPSMFQFGPYPTVHMPFDYPQVHYFEIYTI